MYEVNYRVFDTRLDDLHFDSMLAAHKTPGCHLVVGRQDGRDELQVRIVLRKHSAKLQSAVLKALLSTGDTLYVDNRYRGKWRVIMHESFHMMERIENEKTGDMDEAQLLFWKQKNI